ncbi:DUF4113 domain-containing protein [Sphingomonas qilianensis]
MDRRHGVARLPARMKLRSEMRSPAWTTSIAEVPTVRA